jgi:hypothetical protein
MDPKHLCFLAPQCSKDLDLVVDLRKMVNKRKGPSPLSSIVHPDCTWGKGHMVHIFYMKKSVLSFVLSLSAQDPIESNKRVLETVPLAQCADMDYEAEEEPKAAAAPKPIKKKAKIVVPE